MELKADILSENKQASKDWRLSSETILPQHINKRKEQANGYDIYPFHTLGSGKINTGYESLVNWIITQKTVRIDGFIGIFWEEVQQHLDRELQKRGLSVNWVFVADKMKGSTEIQKMVTPFLGEQGSVWGTKTSLKLPDFFHYDQLVNEQPDANAEINIAIGIGASLVKWDCPIVYFDLPKSEVQYRFRAGAATNLGSTQIEGQSDAYKRLYFVDWTILNGYKAQILTNITVIADGQWRDSVNWMFGADLQSGLKEMSQSVFRVRPWFEAGAWGGHWMQERIAGLNKDEVNYAWSFELIVPENGLVFESDGHLLEVSFDCLMFAESTAILGKHAPVFGTEFPIRFDFLDTFDGGNLSIQCHPSLDYIQKEFGENITQDETYYILDCKPNAEVYLGFQENIDPKEFEEALASSQALSQEIDITKYVQTLQANKHDLFLIPNGTVHSAGAENLVLEISATPYIFTFKMYDWMRMGLNGQPRPINIDHAFKNLNFDRKGDKVTEELVSKPSVLSKGADWELIHLPTHREHFYDIHRIEFDTEVTIETGNLCHILMLVEGTTVAIETENGVKMSFNYAETFVVPAAAKSYTLKNTGKGRAKVIKAFVKENVTVPFN